MTLLCVGLNDGMSLHGGGFEKMRINNEDRVTLHHIKQIRSPMSGSQKLTDKESTDFLHAVVCVSVFRAVSCHSTLSHLTQVIKSDKRMTNFPERAEAMIRL